MAALHRALVRLNETSNHCDTCHVLELFLADRGYWVEGVCDAATALERLLQDGFDMLLTDTWLSDALGWNFLNHPPDVRETSPPRDLYE